jgi:NADPH:quinone reductase-like Zn-dependent oxidoreductase
MVTYPLVTATAAYALRQRAAIHVGESVLIHSGAGGIGIAAIQLALQLGAEVYTTVSTKEKGELLVSTLGVNPEESLIHATWASPIMFSMPPKAVV